MRFFSAFLSLLLIFAVVFTTAKPLGYGITQKCCIKKCCEKSSKENSSHNKCNKECMSTCCVNILAIKSYESRLTEIQNNIFFRIKIFSKNDNEIVNYNLQFFHPPEIV